jgi:curved DNA-binding protein CbpA
VKSFAEMSHYEVLEVPRGAVRPEIERAWSVARDTYAGESLATYSLFEASESEELLERIELAYRVLSDPAERAAYDATLEKAKEPEEALPLVVEIESTPRPARPELRPEIKGFEDPEDESNASDFGGGRLRRSRLRRGLELEQIAEITKIRVSYLRCLEEDHYAGLPAPVYVRGFVAAYARCVGLDPQSVAASYMQRFFVAGGAEEPQSRHRVR